MTKNNQNPSAVGLARPVKTPIPEAALGKILDFMAEGACGNIMLSFKDGYIRTIKTERVEHIKQ